VIPLRVVLDTNVLISAYRFAGKPEQILDLALSAAFVSLTSDSLKDELTRVLAIKFLMSEQLIEEACTPFWQIAEWIDPKIETHLCPDEADNRVLECAMDGKANFIVTGDRHLLDLGTVAGFTIVKPDAFLAILQSQRL
jgi:putative PIN family toxin of toxin-antitoxin system